jgi:hypothetical protein
MVRNIGPGTPLTFSRGQRNRGNNAEKRARRATIERYIAANRNVPHSRWKREVRAGRL